MKYLKNEPLKQHTSFKIGGEARLFCVPKSIRQLKEALAFAKEKKMAVAVLGAGTNILVLDKGFQGLVIKLAGGLSKIDIKGRLVFAEGGASLPKLLNKIGGKGLSGLEFLAGIPGTVGGAAIMNAGAWGKMIDEVIEKIWAVDFSGNEKLFPHDDLHFGYRMCGLQNGEWIVTRVLFKLKKSAVKTVRKNVLKYLKHRKKNQPLGTPNAGCIFKNPKGKFAGKLLQNAGCKGMRVGDARISSKHANFILNLGTAKASDVIKLITRAQKKVKDKFKTALEPEIKIMVQLK